LTASSLARASLASQDPRWAGRLGYRMRGVIEADGQPGILARMLGSMLQTTREIAFLRAKLDDLRATHQHERHGEAPARRAR
jgi:hypothetical protein